MSNFISISKESFESFLKDFTIVDEPSSKELVYEIKTDKSNINIRIYSSINFEGTSRSIGEDAIRCVLMDKISNKPIDKAKRTHRMINWQDRLKEKIEVLKTEAKKVQICKACGSSMILRDGSNGQFYGCLSFPICNSTTNLFGESPIKTEHMKKELTEEIISSCPDCDAPMVKRNGRRGEWYACSTFFKTGCKGSRTVKEVEIYGEGVEHEHMQKEPVYKKPEVLKQEVAPVVPEKVIPIIATSQYPHLTFRFENFNPVQSEVFQYYGNDVNCVVAAATSAGKTTVAEMFMAHSISQGKKAIFLSPLRAVSQEKYEDWTNESHDWSKLNVSIVTGDYQLTDKRVEELNNANVVIVTSEMLDSRTRRITIEKNNWILNAGTLVVDESHLLCMKGRGDKLESALMRFSKQNPTCRIVLLSATMPNVDELARWLTSLNNKKTELINSKYRPIQLDIHYEQYDDYGKYQNVEQNKIQRAVELTKLLVSKNEQVLVFVHAKSTGNKLLESLHNIGIDAKFHYSDLTLAQRKEIHQKTKTKEIKVLIATSGLAWGINI